MVQRVCCGNDRIYRDMVDNDRMLAGDRMTGGKRSTLVTVYDSAGNKLTQWKLYGLERRTLPEGSKYIRVW